jgi:hypothetical protein
MPPCPTVNLLPTVVRGRCHHPKLVIYHQSVSYSLILYL